MDPSSSSSGSPPPPTPTPKSRPSTSPTKSHALVKSKSNSKNKDTKDRNKDKTNSKVRSTPVQHARLPPSHLPYLIHTGLLGPKGTPVVFGSGPGGVRFRGVLPKMNPMGSNMGGQKLGNGERIRDMDVMDGERQPRGARFTGPQISGVSPGMELRNGTLIANPFAVPQRDTRSTSEIAAAAEGPHSKAYLEARAKVAEAIEPTLLVPPPIHLPTLQVSNLPLPRAPSRPNSRLLKRQAVANNLALASAPNRLANFIAAQAPNVIGSQSQARGGGGSENGGENINGTENVARPWGLSREQEQERVEFVRVMIEAKRQEMLQDRRKARFGVAANENSGRELETNGRKSDVKGLLEVCVAGGGEDKYKYEQLLLMLTPGATSSVEEVGGMAMEGVEQVVEGDSEMLDGVEVLEMVGEGECRAYADGYGECRCQTCRAQDTFYEEWRLTVSDEQRMQFGKNGNGKSYFDRAGWF